jgi:hypothetical protein
MRRIFLVTALLLAGCRGEPVPVSVEGNVTSKGKGIVMGMIQFNSLTNGAAVESDIVDGAYKTMLLPGKHTVAIMPKIEIISKPGSLPEQKTYPANDIPAKYHSVGSSGLSADISQENKGLNFELTP